MGDMAAPGEQTVLSELVLKHAANCRTSMISIDTARKYSKHLDFLLKVHGTCNYLNNISNGKKRGNLSYNASVDELLSSGVFEEDIPLVFRSLMLAQGVPSSIILGTHGDFTVGIMRKPKLFSRVYGSKTSFIIDPSIEPHVHFEEYTITPYVPIAECRDLKDIKVSAKDDALKLTYANYNENMKRFHRNMGYYFLSMLPKME